VRLTLVTNIPTPYRAPLYTLVADRLRARGGRFTVVFGAEHEARSQWAKGRAPTGDVDAVFVRPTPAVIAGRATYVTPRVVGALWQTRPDVVIVGGYAPWTYWVAGWCRLRRVPYLIWSAETLRTAEIRRPLSFRRRPLWAGASGFLAYGPAAREYLLAAGRVNGARITVLGNGIDIDAFSKRTDAARLHRQQIRAELGFDMATILCVGGKNLQLVEQVARRLRTAATIVVVGRDAPSGVERSPFVRQLGHLSPSEMPDIYVAADCLIHVPEFDYWPHAINEALAAGLPVVASRFTGVPDDILSGPGCRIVALDPDAVANAIVEAVQVVASWDERLIEEIRNRLRPWGVDAMAWRIIAAADDVASGASACS
jgi:glycosyltransferase involved in cell wall biosynthesis